MMTLPCRLKSEKWSLLCWKSHPALNLITAWKWLGMEILIFTAMTRGKFMKIDFDKFVSNFRTGRKAACKIEHFSLSIYKSLFAIRLKMQFKRFTSALEYSKQLQKNWKLRRKVSLGVEFSHRSQLKQQQQQAPPSREKSRMIPHFRSSSCYHIVECSWLHEIAFWKSIYFTFAWMQATERCTTTPDRSERFILWDDYG